MRNRGLTRSRAFLTEFVIVILFFGIAAGMIVQVFAAAHQIRQKTNNLTIAAAKVQNLAEYAKASHSKKEYAAGLQQLGAVRMEGNTERYRFYYDRDWQLRKKELSEGYQIEADCSLKQLKSGELMRSLIEAEKIEQKETPNSLTAGKIYNVTVLKYYP